jgi:hypothetical protein
MGQIDSTSASTMLFRLENHVKFEAFVGAVARSVGVVPGGWGPRE